MKLFSLTAINTWADCTITDDHLQKGRKHCRKRKNCSSRAMSPFPIVFSKDMYCRHFKTRVCLNQLKSIRKIYHNLTSGVQGIFCCLFYCIINYCNIAIKIEQNLIDLRNITRELTITKLSDPAENSFREKKEQSQKRRKWQLPPVSSFPTMFFTFQKRILDLDSHLFGLCFFFNAVQFSSCK